MPKPLAIAKTSEAAPNGVISLLSQLANRHGCITGATGTGKTVTLQVMAQAFSDAGVPVFLSDVKGDLSGIAKPGANSPKMAERLQNLGVEEPQWRGCPVTFWDVFGEAGHPVRATISDLGPLLLSRMLNLNDTQEGVLQIAFRIADDDGILLLDMKDLRAMLQHLGDNAAQYKTKYGNISPASIGAIQRGLVAIESQGGECFFGEPMLNIEDFIQTDDQGRGVVNILVADKLLHSPRLYAIFLLWMLSELFELLPEVGDPDKPRIVFFFDEAHLLFNEAPKVLLQKIEQVVRLIRSKGVGVYFVTQNPLDIPDTVLGQLGNRIQHALRAYTPRDIKAVQAAAQTFRANPNLDTATAISELGVGEALVSFLDQKGRPNIVQRAFILPPASRIGPLTDAERRSVIATSLVVGVYDKVEDRHSAYEHFRERVERDAAEKAVQERAAADAAEKARLEKELAKAEKAKKAAAPARRGDSIVEAAMKSAARSAGSQLGRQILRGLLGSILRK